ncbi:Regulatory P domain of the subtilisin-like proprotein convertase [Pseudomonas costantinii]|uniref:Regulatory P domain of the subtilisin-like proprotein convertase n=2 Tax=Pseudomonas costantinii TaxID=168469 RepID=A0A1H5D130_9PSED|nr:Regulatory P domain of the subtilisin-like proprotein convertase [Pseudomonas costantinii]
MAKLTLMQEQFGKDRFDVLTKDGKLVAAKWLNDGLGSYVMDPQTDRPYVVPADYDMNASIEQFKKIRAEYDGSLTSTRVSLYKDIYETFRQSGVGDLQRSYNGESHATGADFVPSFTNAASFNFGLISTVLGLTETEVIGGGGLYNLYKSFRPGGQNIKTEGEWWNNEPNVISIKTGMSIIHPDRDGQPLIDQGGPAWVAPPSVLNIEINPDPQANRQVQLENQLARDAMNGYINNAATHKIFTLEGILNKTDFVSTQMASLASGGIRPGEMQLDPNARPNSYLSQFYPAPDATKPDFSLRSAVTLNGLSAMSTFNTYVDPLLLDLTGNGVHMTDIRDGVLFDTDHSGTVKRTGWADRTTGMLVIDDGSGQVKDVSQMFSEYYGGKVGANGVAGEARFKDGFAALASEDANKDGVIDQNDPIWSKLRVWVDGTHDAKVDAGELKTLAELGITQINVRATTAPQGVERDGNRVLATGSFTINGKSQEALAVDFLGDPVSNTLNQQGTGTRVTSTTSGANSKTTIAYASQSTTGETLDAAKLGVNNVYGGAGNDTLIAAATGSWLVGGAGSNTYLGGQGDDVFVISASDDTRNIRGNGGRDTAIIVGSQDVFLNMAQAGLTVAEGGGGNDVIMSGGTGSAFIKGGSGNATLVGGGGNDVLVGGTGHNTIIGGSGKAVIYAGPQGDTIYASEGGSIIHAGGGADKIYGGAGNDVIEVGHGNASIDGDGGVNLVTLHGNHGDYRITRTATGYEVADKVAGRDGTVTLRNIQKLNFSDISAVDLQTPNAMPVADVLTVDKAGKAFDRTQAHLISAEALLANDQRLNSQGALHIANVGDAVGGTVSLTAQGDVLFTPDKHYDGLISFKYGVADAAGNLSASVVDLGSGQSAPMRAGVTLLTPEVPLDPLAAQEWYLSDTHVLPVWKDYTGKGVRIGQFEPGGEFATAPEIFDTTHPDLAPNIDQAWLQTQKTNGTLPGLVSNHATMVAGVMVGAKNGIGGVGVAYDAKLGGYYLAGKGDDLTGLGHMVSFDIANNSWGFTNDFALSSFQDGTINTAAALSMNAQYAASNGRGGLGTIIVAAGGNSRASGGNAQGSLTNNNRFSVEVGAINAQGDLSTLQIGSSPFSNPGASLLVSAPGSNVVSTSHMLETERGSTFGNDYTSMQGTSFAAPIVSGIVALMLEANPNLGYRDVQQILALSARKINDPSTQWTDNAAHAWNGGGLHTSNDYGFGEVDARAAVRLSEAWMTQSVGANEYVYSASSGALGKPLAAGATLTSSIAMNAGLNVEHVEIDFDATVGRLGDLTLKLISPDGTQSVLLNRQGKVPDGMAGASAADVGSTRSGSFKYTFMSTHDFGERSAGNWTLQVTDAASGLPVTLNNWSLRLYGSKASADDTYFYTDEYVKAVLGNAGRAVLDDAVNGVAGGRNTLNAAAVSGDTSVNLLTGVASIGGAALTVKNPSSIQNIVTGDGNDTLVAGNNDALLDGGRGNNTLTGGAGKDFFVVHRRDAGNDTITNFEAARGEIVDLVGFAGKKFADLQLTQQGADVKVDLGKGQSIVLKNQAVAGLTAANFKFQDSFVAPTAYVNSDASAAKPQEGLGTVVLNGGAKGVMYSSDAQGKNVASLSGTVYSHDSATSDVFVVAAQTGVTDYSNALRGFRHGIDKIDLRQTGVTDFSQLTVEHKNRATINNLAQIHGVYVTRNDSNTKLLYLDALDVAQVTASDFIFADHAPAVVAPVGPVVDHPNVDKPVVVGPLPPIDLHPSITIPDPIVVPPITIPDFKVPEHKTLEQILAERGIDLNPKVPEHKTIEQILAERGVGSLEPTTRPDIGTVGRTPIDIPSPRPILIPDIPAVDITHRDLNIPTRTPVDISFESARDRILGRTPTTVDPAGDPNVMTIKGFFADDVTLGDESKTLNIEASNVKVVAGNGDNTVNVTGRRGDISLGNGHNVVTGDIDKLTVGHGNNTITDSGSFTTVKLGDGNNHVVVSGNMPTVEVGHGVNDIEFKGGMGELVFGKDINPNQLWFQHKGQDLQISVVGSKQEVTLHNWYADAPERPRDIMAGDRHRLMDRDVEHLVQAMAAFAPAAPATMTFGAAEQQTLQPVLAANWR